MLSFTRYFVEAARRSQKAGLRLRLRRKGLVAEAYAAFVTRDMMMRRARGL